MGAINFIFHDVGVVFKDTLSISADGIEWKGQNTLSSRLGRAGGVRHSSKTIPTGTDYEIAFAQRALAQRQ